MSAFLPNAVNDTTGKPMDIDNELYPALVQCFFIIGMGYAAGQLNLLSKSHSTGLSRYISNFALPAVVFKNLVDVEFQKVSWSFITSVFVAKAIVFFLTAIITGIGERPRNFASMGLYAIMTSQSNDFALMLPIIDAVYKQSHPEYSRYIYLLAPISLVILNPIGFLLIEIQKLLDDQKKLPKLSVRHHYRLIEKVFFNIIRNPIVICTLLGVVFNRIFNEHLPNMLERMLTPLAQSFSATALFYLGLTMAGRLRRLHSQLVITIFILSMIKLILFPLILRQAVFFFVKSPSGGLNTTIDFSNFGFLYGTAPIAPSVIFYIPESNAALQAIASTGLIFSTLLAGPIMLVSAKMINLKPLDNKLTESYDLSLAKTSYDVSIMSLFGTVIVLIGFCLRRRLLTVSPIHKYTFIFVGIQMVYSIWTIAIRYIHYPISISAATIVKTGNTLIALTIRAWATSISIALMISICYSNDRVNKYFWLYHLFGWGAPICATTAIYIRSPYEQANNVTSSITDKLATVQNSASICLLALCIIITSANLLRIVRRKYQLRQNERGSRSESFSIGEIRPLINDTHDYSTSQTTTTQSFASDLSSIEPNTQLLRHSVLVGLLNITAFVCISVLLWSVLTKNRDGVYYELQFLDVILLHGQGFMTFIIFALDADLLQPMFQKICKLLNRFGLKIKFPRNPRNQRISESEKHIDFEEQVRPKFIRHSIATRSMDGSINTMETIFSESEFCDWLVVNGYMQDESRAHSYCRELMNKKQIVCIDRVQNEQISNVTDHWYAFTK